MATTDTSKETLGQFRVENIVALGFDRADAERLSEAFRDVIVVQKKVARRYQLRVDHHYLRSLLNAGATHDQVTRIVL